MALLKKTLFDEKLETYNVLVEDTAPFSNYFKITELSDVFTGGKNAFLIQGSPELVADSLIKIQIKDSQGNTIYNEPGEGIPEYYEGTSKVVAVYIYPDTSFGPCTITILGELKEYYSNTGVLNPVPANWEGTYNVRWQKQINVNPLLQNTSKIRFYRRPKVAIEETILPIYNRSVNRVTISGSIDGVAINPLAGTNFKTFKGDTLYELRISGSNFSSSMEGETINITNLNQSYSTTIKDVITSKKANATIPYYETSSVTSPQLIKNFSSASFSLAYDESVTLINSSISSSFAKIKLTDLEAFSGDVNRLRIYASRKADIGNYTLLEDIQLESTELLQTDEYSGSVNIRTGVFSSQNIINEFWVYKDYDSSTNYTATLNNTDLVSSVKIVDDGIQNTSNYPQRIFYYSSSLDLLKNTEYQLDFTPILSSSLYGNNIIEIYGSGSAFVNLGSNIGLGKNISKLVTNSQFKRYDKQQVNFKTDADGSGTIVFAVYQGNWQLSNISLRATQETNFSPNEITLNVAVPTKVKNDTFDFKFEFYDINNNYVPVSLNKEFTFTGGNDSIVRKSITVVPDGTFFSFSGSGVSIGQTLINFSITKSGLTGSTTFHSSAFDENGDYIQPSVYGSQPFYPGLLTNVTSGSATLSVANFTGSLASPKVTRVLYSASCEDVRDLVNIYRVDQGGNGIDGIDGSDGTTFITIANKNQFVYDPDNHNVPAQLNDFIDIKLSSNIVSGSLLITSGSLLPKLQKLSTTQVGYYTESVYRVYSGDDEHDVAMLGTNVASWSYNTPTNDIHKGTYLFTQNGFSSSVQLEGVLKGDKSKNLNAVSNANQFFYKMTDVSLSPTGQIITIDVKRNNLGSTSNAITVTSGSGKPALIVGSNNGTTGVQSYSISGSNYPFTAGATTYTFFAEDLNFDDYTDTITITPVIAESQIAVNVSNENTTFPAYSGGSVFGGFLASSGSISVKVGSEDISYASTIANNRFSASISSSTNVTTVLTNNNYSITALSADSGSLDLKVIYRDGRGSDSVFTKVVTYSKAKAGAPNVLVAVSPSAQSIAANSRTSGSATPTTLTITALEAGTSKFTSIGTPVYTNGLAGTVSSNTITFTSTASSIAGSTAQVTIPVNYTDSEGITGTKNVVATVSKALASAPSTIVFIEKDGQTITRSKTGTYGTPSSFRINVLEGANSSSYDNNSPFASSTFRITNVTNGSVSATDLDKYATITPTTPSSTSGLVVSITGSFVDSEGSTTSFLKTHNVNVATDGSDGATGASGPGIVFRGPWSSTITYFDNDDFPGRRDAVLYSGTYYATKTNATTNLNKQPNVETTFWESLGTDSFFVAAKIIISENSFVQETLNVGTNASGNANITLRGGTDKPYISIAQAKQEFGTNGIYLGITGSVGNAVVSFQSGSNYFKYNSSATNVVDIGGRISATALTADTGSIGGFEIQGGLFQGGGTASGIQLNGTTSTIVVGNLSTNASARISPAGFFAGNTSFGSAPFSVDLNGALVATNADVRGKITATQGTIGGWLISENSISKNRVTLNAGASDAENYIQITGTPGGSFAGNRVYIHPGELTDISGGSGNAIAATNASSYVNISSANTIYAGNSSTTATMGTSAQTVTSLSASSTFNLIAKLRFKIDVAYESVATTQVGGQTNTRSYQNINNAAGQMAWSTLVETGFVNLTSARPEWGWIPNADNTAVSNFFTQLYNATGVLYSSIQQMANDIGSWTVTTALSYMYGSIGVNSAMTYKTTSGGTTISTFTPNSQITSEELAEVTYTVNSTGNTTTGPSFAITKSNTLQSIYRRVTWRAGYYDINFTGYGGSYTNYSGYAIWAETEDNYVSTPTSVTYSAKTTSLTANALTKQVELSEAGMQAVFNATNSSEGNYFRVSDVGTPTISNFNIKSAGFFAHYGELHVKGDIAGFSTALSSDRRLKKDIVDIEAEEIEDMDKLHPVTYSWKDDKNNKKHYGFIAQDVQKIYPHLTETKIMGEYLTINYNELIPVMVKQIQNLKKELEDVKKVLANGK